MNYNFLQEILYFSTPLLILAIIFAGFFVVLRKINLGINTILISIMLFSLILALGYSSNKIDDSFIISTQASKIVEGIITFSQKITFIFTTSALLIFSFNLVWFYKQNKGDSFFKQKTLFQKLIIFLKKHYYILLGIFLILSSYTLVFTLSNFLNNL